MVSKARRLQIKFWIICLANLLKNFRWLFFSLTLKQSIIIVQGDKSHLYVIQFTRYSRCLADSLTMIPNVPPVVKPFFDFLQNLFGSNKLHQSACYFIAALSQAPEYISTSVGNCQAFFSYFPTLSFCSQFSIVSSLLTHRNGCLSISVFYSLSS